MKKTLYLFLFIGVLISNWVNAQTFTPNLNYTYSRVFLDSVTVGSSNYSTAQSKQIVQYTDGLGRIKQEIAINAIKSNQDIITSYFYDSDGKITKQYLPVSKTGMNGALQSVSEADINSYYGVPNAYSEVKYDDSPLNRIVKKASPGADWSISSGHTQDFTYEFNEANTVKKYSATLNTTTFENILSSSGYYPVNTLYKTTVKDEDGNIRSEYKNGLGKVLMSRVKNGSIFLDTYYVYNNYNQLAFVIPPLNANESPVSAIIYQYKYDASGRLTEKKLPGKGKEYYVYDKENRVIMSTDTKLKASGKWCFVKYDQLGRVIYTGLCTGGERAAEQANANAATLLYETRTENAPGFTVPELGVYYTKSAYPTAVTDVLSVNYYDFYPSADAVTRPASIYSQPTLTDNTANTHNTKSLLTASFVRNVENTKWNKTLFWYDTKERLIGNHKITHRNTYTKTEMKLDFPGNITESRVTHKQLTNNNEVVVKQRYVYSAQNLLWKHYHKVDNEAEVLLEELSYDDLGRVISKKVGNSLQTLDYSYNIRGWLTSVNNPANLGTDLFAYKLNFNQREGAETPNNDYPQLQVKPKYNGSIAEITWATSANTGRYGYVYDESGRMLAGLYQSQLDPYQKSHSEIAAYDNRGNIKTLFRTAAKASQNTAQVVDNLAYTYNGNRVTTITDSTGNPAGYKGGGGTMLYDDNGNITAMPDKGITAISYNFLNLPVTVTDLNTTSYIYSADGTKLKKTLILDNNGTPVKVDTEYLDGFQYSTPNTEDINGLLADSGDPGIENARTASEPEAFETAQRGIDGPPNTEYILDLVFFPTSEGFYDYKNKRYIYQYKDHLGNVRVSYTGNANGSAEVLDRNDYYPFGMNHLQGFGGSSHYNPLSVPYNYKYNGKELQETGMYDYGWRMYMPDIARWNGMDQLAESYNPYSPYAYVMNNPVSLFDPDGRVTNDWLMGFWYASGSGITNWTNTGASFMSDRYNDNGKSLFYDYNGNFSVEVYIQEVIIKARGNSKTWNNAQNYGYNSLLMFSKIDQARRDWNLDQARSTLYDAVENTKVGQSVSAAENFLFLELPMSFAGGELFSAGWRAIGAGKYLSGIINNAYARIAPKIVANFANKEGTTIFRYMTEGELEAIQKTGLLRGGRPGETFFTKDIYRSAEAAQSRLALPSVPTLRVEFEILSNPNLILNGTKVQPAFNMMGGGSEFMTTDIVSGRVINWQPLR